MSIGEKELETKTDFHGAAIVDEQGNEIWSKKYLNTINGLRANISDIELRSDNEILLVGNMTHEDDASYNYSNGWIWVVDTVGIILSETRFCGDDNDYFNDIEATDYGYIVVGGTNSFNAQSDLTGSFDDSEGFVLALSKDLDSIWYRVYAYTQGDIEQFSKAVVDSRGDIMCIGTATVSSVDLWYVSLDKCGCDSILCYFEPEENCGIDTTGILNNILVDQMDVYPNPAHNEFRVSLSHIPIHRLYIRDVLGRNVVVQITVVADEYLINTSELESGMYFVFAETEYGVWESRILIE